MSQYPPHLEGNVDASGLGIAIVVARFNHQITDKLLEGAVAALLRHGAEMDAIKIIKVPGAFEIGTIAARLADTGDYQAIICLGCVIRGGTAHFEYVCQGVTQAVGAIVQRGDVGVGFGILTVDTIEQAFERVGGIHGHKGEEAALTAVEIANTLELLEDE